METANYGALEPGRREWQPGSDAGLRMRTAVALTVGLLERRLAHVLVVGGPGAVVRVIQLSPGL